MAMGAAVGQNVRCYCIFDSDFHTPTQISARKNEARARHVSLHIWARKEIENYLLVPAAIARVITSRARSARPVPSADTLAERIFDFAGQLENDVLDSFAQEFHAENRAGGSSQANGSARDQMYPRWSTSEGRLAIVSGKLILARLSEWLQREHGLSISPMAIARGMRRSEIPAEVVDVLTAIENGGPF